MQASWRPWKCHRKLKVTLNCSHVTVTECWKNDQKVDKSCAECKRLHDFKLINISKEGTTAAEYMSVEDKVLRNNQPMHNWHPAMMKIEKIHHTFLQEKFKKAKLKCKGKHSEMKFHGTGEDGIKSIPKDGFKLPQPAKPGERKHMFGCGIYFSTDSSKSAQEIYTKGTGKLLLCEVILGNAKKVCKADPTLTLEQIRKEGYDSVFAPRDTQNTGGVMNDEFVIFDPDQALPKYIIHYQVTSSQTVRPQSLAQLANQKFKVTTIEATKRVVDLNDPYKPHFDNALAMFYKVISI